MPLWMKIMNACVLLLLLFFLWPRAKHVLEESRQAKERDWVGFLLPMAMVCLFVIWLIAMR